MPSKSSGRGIHTYWMSFNYSVTILCSSRHTIWEMRNIFFNFYPSLSKFHGSVVWKSKMKPISARSLKVKSKSEQWWAWESFHWVEGCLRGRQQEAYPGEFHLKGGTSLALGPYAAQAFADTVRCHLPGSSDLYLIEALG